MKFYICTMLAYVIQSRWVCFWNACSRHSRFDGYAGLCKQLISSVSSTALVSQRLQKPSMKYSNLSPIHFSNPENFTTCLKKITSILGISTSECFATLDEFMQGYAFQLFYRSEPWQYPKQPPTRILRSKRPLIPLAHGINSTFFPIIRNASFLFPSRLSAANSRTRS